MDEIAFLSAADQARLRRVTFEDCRLEEADFREAQLTEVRFERCDLTRALGITLLEEDE